MTASIFFRDELIIDLPLYLGKTRHHLMDVSSRGSVIYSAHSGKFSIYFLFGSSRNRSLGRLFCSAEGYYLVHRMTSSGPESEVSGLESAGPCSPRQGVVSASDTRWRQRNILAARGAVAARENSPGRRGILGVSTQGQAGHLSPHCPPIKRTTPLWGKAWYCPAWRWESCSIWC